MTSAILFYFITQFIPENILDIKISISLSSYFMLLSENIKKAFLNTPANSASPPLIIKTLLEISVIIHGGFLNYKDKGFKMTIAFNELISEYR